jgi:O-methyltransferase involved in polyketide biosynthesis
MPIQAEQSADYADYAERFELLYRRSHSPPLISFFTPTEMLTLARDAGFREVRHVSAATLAQRYFAGRTDGLRPPNNSEELLVATT